MIWFSAWRRSSFSPRLVIRVLSTSVRANCPACARTTEPRGSQTLSNQIPATAEALLEARLVARQDPRKVYEALRRHVAARMPDAELDFLEGVPAARMDAADPVIARAIAAASKAAGSPVLVYPSLGGTLPLLHAAAGAGHRFVGLPLVNFDNNQHVGNENLRLAVLPEGIEFLTRFLDALAAP